MYFDPNCVTEISAVFPMSSDCGVWTHPHFTQIYAPVQCRHCAVRPFMQNVCLDAQSDNVAAFSSFIACLSEIKSTDCQFAIVTRRAPSGKFRSSSICARTRLRRGFVAGGWAGLLLRRAPSTEVPAAGLASLLGMRACNRLNV